MQECNVSRPADIYLPITLTPPNNAPANDIQPCHACPPPSANPLKPKPKSPPTTNPNALPIQTHRIHIIHTFIHPPRIGNPNDPPFPTHHSKSKSLRPTPTTAHTPPARTQITKRKRTSEEATDPARIEKQIKKTARNKPPKAASKNKTKRRKTPYVPAVRRFVRIFYGRSFLL